MKIQQSNLSSGTSSNGRGHIQRLEKAGHTASVPEGNRQWKFQALVACVLVVSLLGKNATAYDSVSDSALSEGVSQQVVTVAKQAPQPRRKVLLAGIGGWKSCLGQSANDQYISNRFFQLVCNLRRCRPDLDISYVMYCSPGLKENKGCDEVRVHGRFGDSKVAEKSIGCSIAKHKCSPDSMVFVMGHSHGGWMAMRATVSLGNVDGLYTMEPVSAAQCTTRDYLKTRERKFFKWRQKIVPGCRRAPTDVNRAAIVAATGGNWTNFFLAPNTEKGSIYSSPIPEAHNHMIWAPAEGKYNAHHNLGLSATTWAAIEANILATVDAEPLIVSPVSEIETAPTSPQELETTGSIQLDSAQNEPELPGHARVWRDASGKFARTGTFVEFSDDLVTLDLSSGGSSSISIGALSQDDQNWVKATTTSSSLASK